MTPVHHTRDPERISPQSRGLPGFVETVEAIASELEVERIIVAEETTTVSPHIQKALIKIFDGGFSWNRSKAHNRSYLTPR